MDSLKNCPFCGAEAVMETFTTAMEKKPRFRVRCTSCPCDLGWDHWSVEEARDAWNMRTEGKDNREKVIKGLECLSNPYVQDMDERDCENCQYDNSCCFLDVTADALSLLKAQEPRVMTYDEMMKAEICFLEVKEIEEINPYIRFEVDDKSYWSSPYTNNEDNPFELLAEQEEYLINARCWTSRPTDEQREATPWPEPKKEEGTK